ncbi:MAG: uL15m family ribosomal protein [bacterium]|nr:uL15m family ribosomal protein [bacterium]
MALTRTHKRKKYSRMHGKGMGTAGTGARKNKRKSGNKGGIGMAGSGKRADHKKTLITKLYGNDYFGKQGITSKGTKKDKEDRINLETIELNLQNLVKKGKAKKSGDGYELDLGRYKILGEGNVKNKLIIKAKSASESAMEKVNKAGGKIQISKTKEIEK